MRLIKPDLICKTFPLDIIMKKLLYSLKLSLGNAWI